MKIALVNNLYGSTKRGGAENLLEVQAELLRQAGHKVVIVTTRPWGSGLAKKADGLLRLGGFAGFYYHLGRWPWPLRLLWHLEELFNLWRPWRLAMELALSGCELVIGHNLTGLGLWLPRMAVNFKMRFILVVHDTQYLHPGGLIMRGREKQLETLAAKAYQSVVRYALAPVERVVSPSLWLGELYVEKKIFPQSKIVNLANPIKLESGMQAKPLSSRRLVFVGQLEAHKGVLELIRAFRKIEGDCQLDVVGQGSLLEEVRQLAQHDARITVYGALPRTGVSGLLAAGRALVVPSLCYENQPTVILEAFALGLPVLASDFAGTAELLKAQAGLTFDPRNEADLRATLLKALAWSELELGPLLDGGRQALAKFDFDRYRVRFRQLIELKP